MMCVLDLVGRPVCPSVWMEGLWWPSSRRVKYLVMQSQVVVMRAIGSFCLS